MEPFENAFRILEKAVETGAAPCTAAAVGTGGKLLRWAVYGSARTIPAPVPADLSTRFDMASLTKILSTTMVALHFLETGQLRLQDTIGDFFCAPSMRASVTVLQLLTHTGGFVPHMDLASTALTQENAVNAILTSEPVCKPGEQVYYSCMGFIVLGKILEKIGGASLDMLARELVFSPLHMTHTDYNPTGCNFAATELLGCHCLEGVVHDENARFLGGVSGNAGVFSNLEDMTRFASMLACGGVLDGKSFLSPAVLEAATRCYTPGLNQNRGLGFHLQSTGSFHGDLASPRCFGHTGFTGTSLVVDPDTGLYAVLLSNRVHPTRDNTAFLQTRRLFHNAVFGDFFRMNT